MHIREFTEGDAELIRQAANATDRQFSIEARVRAALPSNDTLRSIADRIDHESRTGELAMFSVGELDALDGLARNIRDADALLDRHKLTEQARSDAEFRSKVAAAAERAATVVRHRLMT